MTEAPEPKDKLDATTVVGVSGPEDDALGWRQIDWRRAEADVRRLRQRIFTASQVGDLARVRSLQKLMLRSRANTLVSVRRVTERNAGRLTPGVDGEVVLTPEAKMQLVERIQHAAEPFKALPVRRVYIPKQSQAVLSGARSVSRGRRQSPPGSGRQCRSSAARRHFRGSRLALCLQMAG